MFFFRVNCQKKEEKLLKMVTFERYVSSREWGKELSLTFQSPKHLISNVCIYLVLKTAIRKEMEDA